MTRTATASRARLAAAALLLAAALPAALPPRPARAAQAPLDRSPAALAAAVDPMLKQRAAAFRGRDVEGFLATVDGRDKAFRDRQRDLVLNARNVPFASYTLRADTSEIGDLSRAADRRRFGDDTVVLNVREEYELAGGYDAGTVAVEDLFLTLTRDAGGRWKVAADDAVEDAGLLSARHPWDFAPVSTRASEHFLVIYPPNQAGEAPKVLAEAEAAYRDVAPVWTPRWNTKVAMELPRNAEDLGRRIQATFPLDNFVAFAASTIAVEDLSFRYVGRRVMVNPANFLGNSTEGRRQILAHELVHIATRESSGPYLTAWVEEGVAQVLGENESAVGLTPVRTAVRSGRFAGRFPHDYEFLTGGGDRIFRSYAEAYLVAREIQKIAGTAGLIRFYVEAGDRGRLGPGTVTYRLDLATRRALGMPLAELERRWAADVKANRLS